MFAFVIWKDRIEVLAPQEEDHVYKAGAWGRERRLREGGVYRLQGVMPGTAPPALNANENLIVSRWTEIERDRELLFCALNLPLPESMTGLRRVKADSSRRLFGGAAAATLSPQTLPLIQVLTYGVEDSAKLRFDPIVPWVPAADAQGVVNLHIWAESECLFTEMERDHPMHGFECMMRLFPGRDLKLSYSPRAAMDGSVELPGMQVWEQATLRERSRLLFGVPEEIGDGRGAEVTNCLALVVDNRK